MERIYNDDFNVVMNAVHDSFANLGKDNYKVNSNKGIIEYENRIIQIIKNKAKTQVITDDDSFSMALLDEISLCLGGKR